MAEKFGFFDSIPEDKREYSMKEFSEYFARVLTNGIFNGGTNLQVSCSGTDINSIVNTGYAWINGYMYKNDASLSLAHDLPDAVNDRIDRIVLRLDTSMVNRYLKAFVLNGTPSANPVAPDLTRNTDVYEISLAQVRIIHGKSFIEAAQITDERLDASVCGLVNSLVQVDTVTMQAQFDAFMAGLSAQGINAQFSAISSNIAIQQRDILRIKMRQTGLNLDPNAWSDSIEDTSGINIGLSSGYVFDSTNKSLKASTAYTYDCSVLPTSATPAWTKSGVITESVSSGILTLTSTTGNYPVYMITDNAITAATTKKIRCNFKINSGTGAFIIRLNDGAKGAYVLFYTDGSIKYINTAGTQISIATGQTFTSYADWDIELNSGGLNIYKNNVQVGSTVTYSNIEASGNKSYGFGIGEAINANVDYVYVSVGTGAGTATLIWNAVTSEGVLTKGIIESIQNLGTGTMTYYISRNGGTTFTQCTLDTLTSISTQPTGTNIVLKIIITGNAELLAVAWGGTT